MLTVRSLEDRPHGVETQISEKRRYSDGARSLSSEVGGIPDLGRRCPRTLKMGSYPAATGVFKGWLYGCWEKTANWTQLLLLEQTAATEVKKHCWGDTHGGKKSQ